MAERFFSPDCGTSDRVQLEGDEARHLARVRRIRPGEHVTLFDGAGQECLATVAEIRRDLVELTVIQRQHVDRELPIALTLACAPAKGDRLRWLIEKAAELGVARFVPILPERASEQARALRPDRTQRWVVEASKQCGRNTLMAVSEPVSWLVFLSSVPQQETRLLAAPGGCDPIDAVVSATVQGVTLAVGPEGGFTESEERAAVEQGWVAVDLGARILRVETAALALVARVAGAIERLRRSIQETTGC